MKTKQALTLTADEQRLLMGALLRERQWCRKLVDSTDSPSLKAHYLNRIERCWMMREHLRALLAITREGA